MCNAINGGKTACFNITVFAEMVMKQLKDLLGDGYSISVSENRKNNGITPVGLSISSNSERPDAGVIIYLEGYLESYNEGDMDIRDICENIIKVFHENMRDFDFDAGSITSFDKVKDQLRLKLVNSELNKEQLYMQPHRSFRDLAIVYYLPLQVNGYAASMTVSLALMELWGVDEDELYNTAIENVKHKSDYCIIGIADLMKYIAAKSGLNVEDGFCAPPPDMEMYVATNASRELASNIILNNNMLKEFSDSIHGRDFYILPSSIHDLIFIPATDWADVRRFSEMVKDVNDNELDKEEILSYSVYRYNRDRNSVIVECYG